METDRHYLELAAAWVRGVEPSLVRETDEATVEAAIGAGLRVHRFKRMSQLPRVRRVLGILRSFAPSTLLDIGTGRGAFLWPLLDEIPEVDVTCLDVLEHRVSDIEAVRRGGISRVRAVQGDICTLAHDSVIFRRFDVVTALEVLEHVENPGAAARAMLDVAERAIVVTVPSKPDDNPEHLRLFTKASLSELFEGARRIEIGGVLDHMVAVVQP
jgi:cyclopropane fatty-acyl-phospholipid synthase-like methyltransferase